jgi:hypothetical protein
MSVSGREALNIWESGYKAFRCEIVKHATRFGFEPDTAKVAKMRCRVYSKEGLLYCLRTFRGLLAPVINDGRVLRKAVVRDLGHGNLVNGHKVLRRFIKLVRKRKYVAAE